MGVRCGADIVEVRRVEKALSKPGGGRFAASVFTDAEARYCEAKKAGRFESYAARFAAKEAALKALGIGLFAGAELVDIEVVNDACTGAPVLLLHNGAKGFYERMRGKSLAVSLSHTAEYALATVVIECD
ncbi:MAG: holo-ACP synthase [Clostridiales bacterium]|jgi:holo-[acyl-carrier protein] synthase|nr:holo-ACP synthase [Clostridiales bacterium]